MRHHPCMPVEARLKNLSSYDDNIFTGKRRLRSTPCNVIAQPQSRTLAALFTFLHCPKAMHHPNTWRKSTLSVPLKTRWMKTSPTQTQARKSTPQHICPEWRDDYRPVSAAISGRRHVCLRWRHRAERTGGQDGGAAVAALVWEAPYGALCTFDSRVPLQRPPSDHAVIKYQTRKTYHRVDRSCREPWTLYAANAATPLRSRGTVEAQSRNATD